MQVVVAATCMQPPFASLQFYFPIHAPASLSHTDCPLSSLHSRLCVQDFQPNSRRNSTLHLDFEETIHLLRAGDLALNTGANALQRPSTVGHGYKTGAAFQLIFSSLGLLRSQRLEGKEPGIYWRTGTKIQVCVAPFA
jgi:hypothetical protein